MATKNDTPRRARGQQDNPAISTRPPVAWLAVRPGMIVRGALEPGGDLEDGEVVRMLPEGALVKLTSGADQFKGKIALFTFAEGVEFLDLNGEDLADAPDASGRAAGVGAARGYLVKAAAELDGAKEDEGPRMVQNVLVSIVDHLARLDAAADLPQALPGRATSMRLAREMQACASVIAAVRDTVSDASRACRDRDFEALDDVAARLYRAVSALATNLEAGVVELEGVAA